MKGRKLFKLTLTNFEACQLPHKIGNCDWEHLQVRKAFLVPYKYLDIQLPQDWNMHLDIISTPPPKTFTSRSITSVLFFIIRTNTDILSQSSLDPINSKMASINWLAENADVMADVLRRLEVTSFTITDDSTTGGGTGMITFDIPEPVQVTPAAAKAVASKTDNSWSLWGRLPVFVLCVLFCGVMVLIHSLYDDLKDLSKRLDKALPNPEVDVEAGNGGTSGSEEGVVDSNPDTTGAESAAEEEEKEALLKNSPDSESDESDADSTSSWEVTAPSAQRK